MNLIFNNTTQNKKLIFQVNIINFLIQQKSLFIYLTNLLKFANFKSSIFNFAHFKQYFFVFRFVHSTFKQNSCWQFDSNNFCTVNQVWRYETMFRNVSRSGFATQSFLWFNKRKNWRNVCVSRINLHYNGRLVNLLREW